MSWNNILGGSILAEDLLIVCLEIRLVVKRRLFSIYKILQNRARIRTRATSRLVGALEHEAWIDSILLGDKTDFEVSSEGRSSGISRGLSGHHIHRSGASCSQVTTRVLHCPKDF